MVAIGASAGGLQALEALFDNCRDIQNASFVVIQHLSSDYKSIMDQLLSKHTAMQVGIAEHGQKVEDNHTNLIPSGKILPINDNRFLLQDKRTSSLTLPIDIFFSSVASNWQGPKLGIILSGTGSDGSNGIVASKQSNGTTIVQSPTDAKFDGMPNSAINTGCIDVVKSARNIGQALLDYSRGEPFEVQENPKQAAVTTDENSPPKTTLFHIIKESSGIDFSGYKQNTLDRRLARAREEHNLPNLEALANKASQAPDFVIKNS